MTNNNRSQKSGAAAKRKSANAANPKSRITKAHEESKKDNIKSAWAAAQLRDLKGPQTYIKNNGGGGAIAARGRVGDAEKYRERARENQKFPNTRKKYLTGKDLTTPLYRKRLDPLEREKRIEAQKNKYKKAEKEQSKIKVKQKVEKADKTNKTGWSAIVICFLIVFTALLMGNLITEADIHEKNVELTGLNDNINDEIKREAILTREYEIKNDLKVILAYAADELGMVKEESLQKHYLVSVPENRIIEIEDKNNISMYLPDLSRLSNIKYLSVLTNILAAYFNGD